MFRMLILLLALTLLPVFGMAEAPLTFADDLTGVYTWPEGSSEADATYVYRYTYPQIAGEDDLAVTINNVFQYEVTDAFAFEIPMNAPEHPADEPQMQVTLSSSVEHLSDNYLSVRINKQVTVGENTMTIVKAITFALTGPKAGAATSLPYLLGLLKDASADEWLITRQTEKVAACARELVWMNIRQDMKSADSPIWEDLTEEELVDGFYPEEDFYLNEAGDLVFFIQENVIAPPEAGLFVYTVTMDEMLDEI